MTIADLLADALAGSETAEIRLEILTESENAVEAAQATAALATLATRRRIAGGLVTVSGAALRTAGATDPGLAARLQAGALVVALVAALAIVFLVVTRRGR